MKERINRSSEESARRASMLAGWPSAKILAWRECGVMQKISGEMATPDGTRTRPALGVRNRHRDLGRHQVRDHHEGCLYQDHHERVFRDPDRHDLCRDPYLSA